MSYSLPLSALSLNSSGQIVFGAPISSGAVSSITGTANEVIASASSGAVTLSLPQAIGTGSSPSFLALTITNNIGASSIFLNNAVVCTNLQAQHTAGFGTATLSLFSDSSFGVEIQPQDSMTASFILKLPLLQGGTNTCLQNDGTGILGWSQALATTSTPSFSGVSLNTGGISITSPSSTTGGAITLTTGGGSANGGNLTLTTGGGGTAGSILMTGGTGSGSSGGITLSASGLGGTGNIQIGGSGNVGAQAAGSLILKASGQSGDPGGASILLTTVGSGGTQNGGSITLTSSGTGNGGSITLTNGGTTGNGGSITLTAFTPATGGNLFLTGTGTGFGQVGVGTSSPNATASVDITSTTRGFLPPRMTTTQKNAISSPATGLVVFDTTLGKLCVFSTTWQTITSA